jgi:N-acetylglucosaminyldiphosphoundecaprenol N-acetyl-beta-D-mannosaminyltransferase
VWTEGYADAQHPSEQEEEELAAILRHVRPRIVFVALGAPLQEHWILEHEQLLHTHGVRVAMVVGGAFDMLLGLTPRAPLWMRRIGLEWLYRLCLQPWRVGRQVRLLQFCGVVLRELFD